MTPATFVLHNCVGMVDHPGYLVCYDGRVYSCKRGVVMTPKKGGTTGYYKLELYTADRRRVRWWYHRLICTAWHGPPRDGQQARHLDGDPSNNASWNLRWGTPGENIRDKYAHGTMGKLTEQDVSDILRILAEEPDWSRAMVAEVFGVSVATVNDIASGRTWKHLTKEGASNAKATCLCGATDSGGACTVCGL